MCSFILANWAILNLTYVNFFLKPRGPDATSHLHLNGFDFVHNLLHMTGEQRTQPFMDSGVAALFNGEVYNWRSLPLMRPLAAASDGDAILPAYRMRRSKFSRQLDGEYAIVIVDFVIGEVLLSTDVFGTKPLWYSLDRAVDPPRFAVASYKSALSRLGMPDETIKMVDPNTVLRLSLNEDPGFGRVLGRHAVFEFDLRQFKTSTDDYVHAFKQAVEKRTTGLHPAFIGLSSGYDSGAVHLALHEQGKQHYAFTIYGEENINILSRRINYASSTAQTDVIIFAHADFQREWDWLAQNMEHFDYLAANITGQKSVVGDQASAGLSYVMRLSRDRGALAYLSGSGADEVLSDYGFRGERLCSQSSFGGLFPEHMLEIFPWPEFFLSTQRDYLMKEELVAGAHGMEGRYPFLDPRVVQEYFWLKDSVKNDEYKAPLYSFLAGQGYPFERGKKQGFAAAANHLAEALDVEVPAQRLSPEGARPTVVMRYNAHKEPRCGAPPASQLSAGAEARCKFASDSVERFGSAASNEPLCLTACSAGHVLVQDTLRCSLHGRWVGSFKCVDEGAVHSPAILQELQDQGSFIWGAGAPEAPWVVDGGQF